MLFHTHIFDVVNVLCATIFYDGKATIVVRRGAPLHEIRFSLDILKSHPFSILHVGRLHWHFLCIAKFVGA